MPEFGADPRQTAFYLACLGIATFLLAKIYRVWWKSAQGDQNVPTGFGVLFAPFCLLSSVLSPVEEQLINSLMILSGFSLLYWWDDYRGLAPGWRVLLCFLAGIFLAFCLLPESPKFFSCPYLSKVLLGGCLLILTTNIVNFSDGADCNLALWILLAGTMGLMFGGTQGANLWIYGTFLVFAVGFGLLNFRPRNIYLGDSGSFGFAGLLVSLAIAQRNSKHLVVPPEIFLTAAFPLFDFFYVLFGRWRRGANLLQRHYEHLYQQIQIQRGGYLYLLPQILNLGICLLVGFGLIQVGISSFWGVLLGAVLITPVVYFWIAHSWIQNPKRGKISA